jgi:hypothetical protein
MGLMHVAHKREAWRRVASWMFPRQKLAQRQQGLRRINKTLQDSRRDVPACCGLSRCKLPGIWANRDAGEADACLVLGEDGLAVDVSTRPPCFHRRERLDRQITARRRAPARLAVLLTVPSASPSPRAPTRSLPPAPRQPPVTPAADLT